MADTMRAWQFTSPGALESTLKLNTVPKPAAPSAGQVLIRVLSAALNPVDYKTPEIGLVARAALTFPKTAGQDFSGTVAAVGPDVADVSVGDLVTARLDPMAKAGTLAEYVLTERERVAVVPASVDVDEAAGAPTVALTAYQTLVGNVKEGDKVFINGGSGGVGTCAIQVAKALGCHVTVSCSTAKMDLCKSLGADEAIDYTRTDVVANLAQRGPTFALVMDVAASSMYRMYSASKGFLVPDGKYVLIGGSASLNFIVDFIKAKLVPGFLGGGQHSFQFAVVDQTRSGLEQVGEWVAQGKVRIIVDSTYEFEDAVKAYKQLKKGSSTGKIVVHVGQR
ncbi:hypothetical protein S7711_07721 [Stachybotrys chartarum IBT 7711]|uniref:Enoyl reductase (ER) domain-containing protein n=1 Tax=Stachybotrys chartarum (strain CBS 109288 / IBT 7711) TaxID=1280523 RepID=A0A084B7Z6_STACB|nr:hypothetical protein S7711_07721 [Stachybotrys chartarum IBT 7711]KFA56627.1 hypothetical protein S40293_01111 [Stachybotrys chartarum IBT 40293]KFA72666.1 hypothetical protein S40288_03413 [Stachybotrys chartarum IBT 40288]